MITGSKRLLNFIDGRMKRGQIIWKAAVRWASAAHPRRARPNRQHTTLLFLVHVGPDVRRGPGDGRGVSEPAEAADRHLPSRQCRGLPRQPGRALGTRHRHPESAAAGSKPNRCVGLRPAGGGRGVISSRNAQMTCSGWGADPSRLEPDLLRSSGVNPSNCFSWYQLMCPSLL